MRSLTKMAAKQAPPELNLYITDTLGNPFVEEEQLWQIVEAIAKSRGEQGQARADDHGGHWQSAVQEPSGR